MSGSLDYPAAKRELTMRYVLGLLGWRCRRVEAGWSRGGCPLHQRGREHGDCFAARDGGAVCHSCGWHGDQLRLWADRRCLPLYSATLELYALAGRDPIYLPRRARRPREGRDREEAR